MAWSNSKIFRSLVADVFGNVCAADFDADSFKVALYNNSITPDQDVTSANSAYNVDQWGTANEVYDAGQWEQAGETLAGQSLNSATAATVFFDATDLASDTSATLTNVYGCQVYDDTLASPVADQGASFNYFGGVQSITDGTFTIVWHANGIWRVTL